MSSPAVRAVRDADARVEQPQVVVDLGDRADGRARVARRRLLVDRDRRRQALDEVDVGLVHLAEELPGVRRQRLDVAALALGVDRVERQRRLARARQTGEHDQLVAREHEVDVAEVVLARPADDDRVAHCRVRVAGSSTAERTSVRTVSPARRRDAADDPSARTTATRRVRARSPSRAERRSTSSVGRKLPVLRDAGRTMLGERAAAVVAARRYVTVAGADRPRRRHAPSRPARRRREPLATSTASGTARNGSAGIM